MVSDKFAPGIPRDLETGWLLFPKDAKDRKELFFPEEVRNHPAKMNFHLQMACIEFVSKPGDILLDPFGGCYDTETEVLTKAGWKFFKDVTLEDDILTLNGEYMEYHKPIRLVNRPYKGKMYHVHTTQIDLLVTPEHNMYVAPRKSLKPSSEWEFGLYPARDIAGKWVHYKKEAKWSSLRRVFFQVGDTTFEMDDWLKFFGLWLAEGYTVSTQPGQVGIRHTNEDLLWGEIAPILEKYGIIPNNTTDLSRLEFTNHDLWNYLSQLGKAQGKYVPREFMDLPSNQLQILLDYYLMGDGSKYGKQKSGWTSSYKLAGDLQEIALKTGISANTQKVFEVGDMAYMPSMDRVITAKHDHYRVGFLQPSYGTNVNSNYHPAEEWVDYNGTIHCVEVPNHIMYIRRNGKPVWCGNTGTLLIATLQGMSVILLEIEEGYHKLQQQAVDNLRGGDPEAADRVLLLKGDNRLLLPIPCNHIITSPPYSSMLHQRTIRKGAEDDAFVKMDKQINAYSKNMQNIGALNNFMYNQAMERVYKLCYQSLPIGGTLTIILKDRIENQKRVSLTGWAERVCIHAGFNKILHEKWKTPGIHFTAINKMHGLDVVEDESIIVMQK